MVFRTHSAFYGFGIPTIRSSVMWALHPVDGFGYHLEGLRPKGYHSTTSIFAGLYIYPLFAQAVASEEQRSVPLFF